MMAEAGREIQEVLRNAMAELVKHMRDRLKDGPEGKPLRFKESTVSNLVDFLGSFDFRNVTDDTELRRWWEKRIWETGRMDSKKLSHPAWTGIVLPLTLAVGATFSPEVIRGLLLVAAVIAATWTFYRTEFASRRTKHTAVAGVLFLLIAATVFVLGHKSDSIVKAAQAKKETPPTLTPPTPDSHPSKPTQSAAVPIEQPVQQLDRPMKSIPPHRQSAMPRSTVPHSDKGISMGKDAVAMGHIPDGSKIGDGSVIVGATDANGNTILNRGGLAVGNGARADPTSIAIGARANVGSRVGPVTVQPGAVASFGQQGGITAGQVNVFAEDQRPVTVSYRQVNEAHGEGRPYISTITVEPNRRIDSTSLAFIFDADVSLVKWKYPSGICMMCGDGRLNGPDGQPNNRTLWIYWASPPFLPEQPLTLTVSSATPFKLISVGRGPRAQ